MPNERTPHLTLTQRRAILKALSESLPIKFAAEAAGISDRTVYHFLANGRKGTDPVAVQFVQDLKKATAKGVWSRLREIIKATKKSWQAAAWLCERRHPEHFGTDRKELRELKRQVEELLTEVRSLRDARVAGTTPEEVLPVPSDSGEGTNLPDSDGSSP